jgi:3-hydroxyisobutyrate dehydrogenase-like beta-hydroxyacid dehydrogenase
MGLKMANNLAKNLEDIDAPPLHFSNRTLSKGQSLAAQGAVAEPDFVSLVSKCDIIFTMVIQCLFLAGVIDNLIQNRSRMTRYSGS